MMRQPVVSVSRRRDGNPQVQTKSVQVPAPVAPKPVARPVTAPTKGAAKSVDPKAATGTNPPLRMSKGGLVTKRGKSKKKK